MYIFLTLLIGKTYGLIPIVSEQYGKYGVKYYAVAIVKKKNTGFDLKTLKGKKSCHTGYRRTAGWKVPIGYLLQTKIMPLVECDMISAAKYFNQSCVPGTCSYQALLSFRRLFWLVLFLPYCSICMK